MSDCDRESSTMRRPWPTGGCLARELGGGIMYALGTYNLHFQERRFLWEHSTFPVVCQRNWNLINCRIVNSIQTLLQKKCIDSMLLRCDAVSVGEEFPHFRRTVVPRSSGLLDILKMRALQSFETSGTTYRTTERHIPEERSLEQHLYENLGACSSCNLFPKFIFVLLKIKSISTCIHIFCSFIEGWSYSSEIGFPTAFSVATIKRLKSNKGIFFLMVLEIPIVIAIFKIQSWICENRGPDCCVADGSNLLGYDTVSLEE